MKETTLVHIVRDGCVLMMHRVSKKHDINHGKWIGVGGKFEQGETPEECMRREVYEETGLRVDHYRYCGIVTFVSDDDETEYMHLFTVTGFHDRNGTYVNDGRSCAFLREEDGKRNPARPVTANQIELRKCDEGTLEWLPKEELTRIPHWAGDRIFLPLILDMKIPFFSMKLVYRKGELIHASLNEHNCLVTDRLILRPWMEEDAAALYEWAKSPDIGPKAGWAPHKDVKESLDSIRDVLMRPEIYAIVLRDTAQPVGSVGLQNFRLVDREGALLTFFDERQSGDPLVCTKPGDSDSCGTGAERAEYDSVYRAETAEDRSGRAPADPSAPAQEASPGEYPNGMRVEAALGYWLAGPYQHQGIMTEAAGAVLAHAWRDLGIRRVWADYYEGNDPSRRVMERLGCHFHHIETDRYLPALNEKRTAIVYVIEHRPDSAVEDGS